MVCLFQHRIFDTLLTILRRSCCVYLAVVIWLSQSVAVHAQELVVGDVVKLVAGDNVPADVRVVEADNVVVLKCVDGYDHLSFFNIDSFGF